MAAASIPRTKVRRHPERGSYDRDVIDAILDEALFCHVGFAQEGHPYVIPMIHARAGDILYLHGSTSSRLLQVLGAGANVCVTVTLLDGVVLARSVFNHSMNYRSVVVLGRARPLTEPDQKLAALKAIVEHLIPGRWRDARAPNDKELATTMILALPLHEASAKIRSSSPKDAQADVSTPLWAGVIPTDLIPGEPVIDDEVPPGVVVPDYVANYRCGRRRSITR